MSTARMLIIDDDTAFCQVLSRHLRRRDIETWTAHDAASAMTLAAECTPDRILLDLRLGADNGLSLIRDLLELCPQARLVLATGYASIATAVEAVRRGAWNYLPKPFDIEALLQAFESTTEADLTGVLAEEPVTLRRQSWGHIQRVLSECDGNVSAAARLLGIDRRTLQRRLAKRPVRERP